MVQERFGIRRWRRSRNSLHRLGLVVQRPQQRLLPADSAKREAFVAGYAALRVAAQTTGAKPCCADEAHTSAAADLRGKWVFKGQPALAAATRPRYGEPASSSAAVCLETGAVAGMPLPGNSTAQTATACLPQLRAQHAEPLVGFWDNAPAHGGEAIRADLRRRLVRWPASNPDCNADQAIGDGVREEVTAHTCLGTAAKVREHAGCLLHRPDPAPGGGEAALPYQLAGAGRCPGRRSSGHGDPRKRSPGRSPWASV
ncbi:MAG: transposase [Chloroflexi bacterium]|nr:transposase [Chloroflexota bacterium]